MAQRTLATKYEAHDAVHSIQRKVFTWSKDTREICYEVEAEEEPAHTNQAPVIVKQDDVPAVRPATQRRPRPVNVTAIKDTPVTPVEILRSIIAQKLKKSLGDVAPRLSIKDLAGGVSYS